MTGIVGKIDREPGKHGINCFDTPKSPASMDAESAVGQLHQSFYVLTFQLAGRRHLLEFIFHKVLISRFPTGDTLLKNVIGQKPREIAAEVLNQATPRGLSANVPAAKPLTEGDSSGLNLPPGSAYGGPFVEQLLDSALKVARLKPADRRLCQELVFGVIRWSATLDWLISQRSRQSPVSRLRNLLCLGLYQIFWLDRIPE